MQPTSALAFSYEDITLYARQPDNLWLSLGSVRLNDPDLQGALDDLRGEAIAQSGAGFTTLLIVPSDQVLYTDATVTSDASAGQEIAQQLEGRTPYAVADLVYDWSGAGPARQVAAVARVTLEEAEAFAAEHGFNPVAVSASVPEGAFAGQPFFGPCSGAQALLAGATLTRETAPFRITKRPSPATKAPAFNSQRGEVVDRLRQLPPRVKAPDALRSSPAGAFDMPPPAPNRFGIWLSLGLLAVLIVIGAIAFFTAPPGAVGRMFDGSDTQTDTAFDLLPEPDEIPLPDDGEFTVAALAPQPEELELEPEPDATDTAALPSEDDVIAEELAALDTPLPTALQIVETYAASGVWIGTPDAPEPAPEDVLLSLYQTTLDAPIAHADAVALPAIANQIEASLPRSYLPPPPPGSTFTVDERGLVAPTAEGIVTPDGVQVIAGAPPVDILPPQRPIPEGTDVTTATDPPDDGSATLPPEAEQRALLARVRPTPRPANSAEAVERSQNNGLTLAELRRPQPQPRPQSQQAQAEEEARIATSVAAAAAQAAQQASLAAPGGTPSANTTTASPGAISALGRTAEPPLRVTPQSDSALAITRSAAPRAKPEDAGQRVAAIQQRAPTQTASVAAVAPRAQPASPPATTRTLPPGGSVARAATQANALPMREVRLIGVFGKPSAPKALVRLRNGRTVRVGVGDTVDNGRVTSIASGRLTYRKSGRDLVLEMPRI